MPPEIVATYSWIVSRSGRDYALELKVTRIRFGGSEESPAAYIYALFANGKDVQLWQRLAIDSEAFAKSQAESYFRSWAVTTGL
jgi:hypothetical protein